MRFVPTFLALACVALCHANTAHADAARDVLTEVAKCADIVDATERLRCYDAAATLAKSALAAPVPPPPAVAEKRSFLEWFGFSRSAEPVRKAEDFGKPEPPPAPGELTEITATLVEFAQNARGRAIFILDNGQVWRQAEGDTTILRDIPSGTTKVTIANGLFTSYNLTIEGRNGLIKVIRLK